MKKLLITTAIIESATGLILVSFPTVIAALLFSSSLDSPAALIVARVAAVALISLGAACWLGRNEKRGKAVNGLVTAMTVYNIGVIIVFIYSAISLGLSGIGLWPVVLVHLAMSFWCIQGLMKNHPHQE